MNISGKQALLIILPLALLIANIAFYAVAVRGEYGKNETLCNIYKGLRGKPKVLEPSGYESYMASSEAIRAFYDNIPDMADFPRQAGMVKDVIESSNLSCGKYVFKSRRIDEHGLWVYSADMIFEGAYGEAKKLLAGIQALPILCCIESLNIKAVKNSNGLVRMDLGLALYCK